MTRRRHLSWNRLKWVRCAATGKRSFPNQNSAVYAAACMMQRQRQHDRIMNAYACKDAHGCGGWHVGHRPRVVPVPGQTVILIEPLLPSDEHCSLFPCKKRQGLQVLETPRGTRVVCGRHADQLKRAYDMS